jgi:hypothetical protein
MKKKIYSILFSMVSISGYAQFGPQQLIDDGATTVKMVRTGDIDGDGDLDVVASLFDAIVWYENLDGRGDFSSQNIVVTGLGVSLSVHLADLDGDLDLDIIITSASDNSVLWFKNLDGFGSFGGANIITNVALGADHAITADLDGDTDLDIISASDIDDIVGWYENTDGLGNFGPRQTITSTASGRSIFAGDIDADTDIDIVSSSNAINSTISWFENLDGQGNFGGEQIIAPAGSGVEDIYVADLDGDSDLDVVFATPALAKVAWHENLDGLGNFGPERIINNSAGFARSVYASDLDNDLDMDVLSASSDFGENISWYENLDGSGNFGPPQQIEGVEAGGTRSVYAADLDGDGDEDALAALLREDKVTWYENLTILGIEDFNEEGISLYPNPVQNILTIQTKGKVTIEVLQIYDALGRLVLEKEGLIDEMDVSSLSSGLFVVKIKTENGISTQKLIKE